MCLGNLGNSKNQASGSRQTPGPCHSFRLGWHVISLPLLVHPFLSLLPNTLLPLLFIVLFSSLLTSRLTLITPCLNVIAQWELSSLFLSSASRENLIGPTHLVQLISKSRQVDQPLECPLELHICSWANWLWLRWGQGHMVQNLAFEGGGLQAEVWVGRPSSIALLSWVAFGGRRWLERRRHSLVWTVRVMGLSVGYLFSHCIIPTFTKLTAQCNNQVLNE